MSRVYLVLVLTLLAELVSSSPSNCTVTLTTQRICNPCHQDIVSMFSKLSSKYKTACNIQFVSLTEKYNPSKETAYPNIIIRSDTREVRYGNELSLVELEYWVNVQCMREVPRCSSWMTQPIFPINVQEALPGSGQHANYMALIDFIIDNPVIKICSDPKIQVFNSTTGTSQEKTIQETITQLLQGLPIFSKFTRNIHNYLLMNAGRITAVVLFYNPSIPSQASMRKSLIDTISYVRNKDRRINYHISDQARKSLIFITDTPTNQMGGKLLQFSKIDAKKIVKEGGIVAFRYRQSTNGRQNNLVLQGLQYTAEANNKSPSNNFLMWLQKIATSNINRTISKLSPLCTHNQIILTTVFNNIHSIFQVFAVVNLLTILDIDQRQNNQFFGIYDQKLRQVSFCRTCNESYLHESDQRVDHVADQKICQEYRANIKFRELEIRQVRYPNDQPVISLCIQSQKVRYLRTTRQLFNFLLAKGYLSRVSPDILQPDQKTPHD